MPLPNSFTIQTAQRRSFTSFVARSLNATLLTLAVVAAILAQAHAASTAPEASGLEVLVRPDGTGDYPTIQSAIDAVPEGTIIRLDSGVFSGEGNRDLNFRQKFLLLISVEGDPATCSIDAGGSAAAPHRAFDLFETPLGCRIEGITVTGGFSDLGGGLRVAGGSRLEVIRCVFRDNTASWGGGVYCRDPGTDVVFVDTTFDSNTATIRGGGLDAHAFSIITVERCTFWRNRSPLGSTIGSRLSSIVNIGASILAFGMDSYAVHCEVESHVEIDCSDVFGHDLGNYTECIEGQSGGSNIELDPLFCGAELGDFRLDVASPCSAINSPCGQNMGAWPVGCGLYGACCLPNGSCGLLPEDGCALIPGAEFLGEGTSCDPDPCPPAYACCFADGYCEVLVETVCEERNGTSLGEGAVCLPLPCGTITVYPDGAGNFESIQQAVSLAPSGATIELADGVFSGAGNRDIDFEGKSLQLRSQSGNPSSCIIDCEGLGRAFSFVSPEESGVVSGITICNGATSGDGGAVYCADKSTPSFVECVFEQNEADGVGGVVFSDDAGPTFERCVLRANRATRGGAIFARRSFPSLTGCTLTGNGLGGAVHCESSAMSIVGSTIAANRANAFGGGLRLTGTSGGPSWITFERSIARFNCANAGAQVFLDDQYSGISFICAAVNPSGVGGLGTVEYVGEQIQGDPLFCRAVACTEAPTAEGDYSVMDGSPCLPENSPCGKLVGARGSCATSEVGESHADVRLHLGLPVPNPSRGTVDLPFSLPASTPVRFRLLDVAGRSLATLDASSYEAGSHSLHWDGRIDGSHVVSGVYYIEFDAAGKRETRRVVILK